MPTLRYGGSAHRARRTHLGSLAIARIAVPVAVCFKKMLTTTTTRIAKPNAASCVVVTTPPPMVNFLLGNSIARGLDVSHRSFMTPSKSNARPSVPSDFTSGSRLARKRRDADAVGERQPGADDHQHRIRHSRHPSA